MTQMYRLTETEHNQINTINSQPRSHFLIPTGNIQGTAITVNWVGTSGFEDYGFLLPFDAARLFEEAVEYSLNHHKQKKLEELLKWHKSIVSQGVPILNGPVLAVDDESQLKFSAYYLLNLTMVQQSKRALTDWVGVNDINGSFCPITVDNFMELMIVYGQQCEQIFGTVSQLRNQIKGATTKEELDAIIINPISGTITSESVGNGDIVSSAPISGTIISESVGNGDIVSSAPIAGIITSESTATG